MKKSIWLAILCLLITSCSTVHKNYGQRYNITTGPNYPPILLDTVTGEAWYTSPGLPVWIPMPKASLIDNNPAKIKLPVEKTK
jgi:hypothetical protein